MRPETWAASRSACCLAPRFSRGRYPLKKTPHRELVRTPVAPVLAAFVVLFRGEASGVAHGLDTAYLELVETRPGVALVRWKSPSARSGLVPIFPDGCRPHRDSEGFGPWRLECLEPLAGQTLAVEGIGAVVTHVVVRVLLTEGHARSTVLQRDEPSWTIPAEPSRLGVATAYFALGLDHIARGTDHLLFLLLVALSLRRLGPILWAESAFTLSHTLSFAATALGWVRVASPTAEAAIALSLVLLARDVLRERGPLRTHEAAGLALVFGLVHGLGFAGAVRELGVPEREVGACLLGFAAGIEVGQVLFVLLAWGFLTLLPSLLARARMLPGLNASSMGNDLEIEDTFAGLRRLGGTLIGLAGATWLWTRLTDLFG